MSFLSGLGHALLKAAPIAANFIPGVGPIASLAIGAGTNALDTKLSGGSWKDAAMSGASSALMSKFGGGGQSMDGRNPYMTPPFVGEGGRGIGPNLSNILGSAIPAIMNSRGGRQQMPQPNGPQYGYPPQGAIPRNDVRTPNLADAIMRGRQEAIMNQPWRSGATITDYGPEPADDAQGNVGPIRTRQLPPIYPNVPVNGRNGGIGPSYTPFY